MRHSLLLIVFFSFLKIQAQTQTFGWTIYDTTSKLNIKKFNSLTSFEVNFSKSFEGFENNRARLTLTDSGNRISPKELQIPDFPVPCFCKLKKDTIFITAALGLMSGLGIITTIHNNQFVATFFQEADNTPVFKLRNSDTLYTDKVSVAAEQQRLTLFKKPLFVGNEIITGTLDVKFAKFYELDFASEPPITRNYKAKLFFKCRLQ